MNKYEEALKEFANAVCDDFGRKIGYENVKKYEPYKIINELVERATPEKPYLWYDNNNKLFDCPKCKTTIEYINDFTEHKFCLNCGQAIDWSD